MVGCLQGKTEPASLRSVNKRLMLNEFAEFDGNASRKSKVEASPGIEPGCKDLQSSASPLRHEASLKPALAERR
jgi:hypothetical protein